MANPTVESGSPISDHYAYPPRRQKWRSTFNDREPFSHLLLEVRKVLNSPLSLRVGWAEQRPRLTDSASALAKVTITCSGHKSTQPWSVLATTLCAFELTLHSGTVPEPSTTATTGSST